MCVLISVMQSNLPLHIGGIWVGECFEVTEGVSEESASLDQNLPPKSLLWTLTLVPDSTYPSAYGASAQVRVFVVFYHSSVTPCCL